MEEIDVDCIKLNMNNTMEIIHFLVIIIPAMFWWMWLFKAGQFLLLQPIHS